VTTGPFDGVRPEIDLNKEDIDLANEKSFAGELNELIMRYINAGYDPQEIVDELIREANLIFGRHNLEVYLVAEQIDKA